MRLGDLEKLGIVAIAQAGELRLRAAPGVITDEIAARIRAVKPELLRELQQRQGATTESATATAEGQPTPAQAAELRRLVRHCGELYNFTEEEHREALEIAWADHEGALTCFRAMAAEIGVLEH